MSEADLNVINAMKKYGGSFVSHLGAAAQHADRQNLAKLKATFPEYWKQYAEMADQKESSDARIKD